MPVANDGADRASYVRSAVKAGAEWQYGRDHHNASILPYRMIVVLRVVLSLICKAALIPVFEGYMKINGCSFPIYTYALRTLVVTMTLGFVGLLASVMSKSTIIGLLLPFCWYCALQAENIGVIFKSVSNEIGVYQVLLLLVSGAAIIFFSQFSFAEKHGSLG